MAAGDHLELVIKNRASLNPLSEYKCIPSCAADTEYPVKMKTPPFDKALSPTPNRLG